MPQEGTTRGPSRLQLSAELCCCRLVDTFWLGLQDESVESMQNEGAYRGVLYTCVAAHWITVLTAMHLVGTTSINPLAMLGEAFTL